MRSTGAFILFLLVLSGFSQSVPRLLSLADEHYEASQYLEAIEYYDKVSRIDKENFYSLYQLGICYELTLNNEQAAEIFQELGSGPLNEYKAPSLYRYANLLKLDSRFEEADSLFGRVVSIPGVTPDIVSLARRQKEGCQLAMRNENIDKGYRVELFSEVNSRFHDFGAVVNLVDKRVVFATTRNVRGEQYEGAQFQGLLPDLVSYELTRGGSLRLNQNDRNFQQLNTEWAQGSGSFTRDGQTFYFSSCDGGSGEDCQILVAYLINDRWTSPQPFE